ncbi:MarR family transcriptional regulator [Candidatus Marinimicrobia bacterium]|nr:MarR family transcriptional regulator [Candidatus Neomarinimicrobiota bacterium]
MSIAENLFDISLNYFALIRAYASRFELTLPQAFILLYIPFDGATISELSNKLGVDISTMTRNLQRIERKKLIIRNINPNDKRSTKLVLSLRGQELSNALQQKIEENLNLILSKYDYKKSHQIKNYLEGLSWELYLFRENLK